MHRVSRQLQITIKTNGLFISKTVLYMAARAHMLANSQHWTRQALPRKAFTICITNYRSNACSRSCQASPRAHTLPIYGCWKQAETSLPTLTKQLRTSLVHEAKNDRHPFQHDSHRLLSVKLYMTGKEPVRVPFSTLAYSSSFTQCLHKSKRML